VRLLRDSRLVLNTPVFDPADPGCELKLRGRAVVVEDRGLLEATANATQAASDWRPPADWHFLSIEVEDVALMEWDRGALAMTRWAGERGIERVTRPAPFLDAPRR
jgi:hypothetical protein